MNHLERNGLVPHECAAVRPGDTFGRLTVLAVGKPPGSYRYAAVCSCSCGAENLVIRIDGLRRGAVVGCGCVRLEATTTHGLTGGPFIGRWRHMMDRCYVTDHAAFKNYGGRGIKVCQRWHDPKNFAADMKDSYRHGLELDRIDNGGDYSPENCRWVTRAENTDNRRSGVRVTFRGRTQSIKRWSEEVGLTYGTLWERLRVWNWTPERALTTPPLNDAERMEIARAARG